MKDSEMFGKDSSGNLRPIRVDTSGVMGGGVARTTNPSVVANGAYVAPTYDDIGRQITYPYQVRELISTAIATPTYGTETTLFAGAANTFHDLIEITAANTSVQAFSVDFRSETGGGIMKTLTIPANNTISRDFLLPLPQSTLAGAWTVTIRNPVADQPDPGVVITATLIKNV